MKTAYIKTYGCQMNVYDSSRMMDILSHFGYTKTDTYQNADIVILNTCHIREKAAEKVYSDLGRIKKEKLKKSDMIIIVAGCVAQAEGEKMLKRTPYIDMVLGSQNYHRLPEFITQIIRKQGKIVELDFVAEEKFDNLPAPKTVASTAFVAIQEGCDNFCTFCVVPYTRGREYSRSVNEIIDEIKSLAEQGVIEVDLLGQNVNSYRGKNSDGSLASLADLINKVAEIDAIKRIRFTTSNPQSMSNELISLYKNEPKLMPFVYLPIQAGSDNILKKMNRKHTASQYLEIIDKLKEARPDIAISSDFIVGFPEETDEDFNQTLEIVKKVKYAQAYSFKYSKRDGTPASIMKNQVDETVKVERLEILQNLINQQQIEFNQNTVGKVFAVLVKRKGKHNGQVVGRSPYMQGVHMIGGDEYMNKLVNVEIKEAFGNSLRGEIV